MSVADSLLRLLVGQGADALIVPPTDPPRLQTRGSPRALSMPPLGLEMVQALVDEVLSPGERASLADGNTVEARHTGPQNETFAVTVTPGARGPTIAFRRPGATPAATPVRAPAREPSAAPRPVASPVSAPIPGDVVPEPAAPAPVAARVIEGASAHEGEPIAAGLLEVIARAVELGASDIIFGSGTGTRLRVGGRLVAESGLTVDDAMLHAVVAPALTEATREALARQGSVDVAIAIDVDGHARRFRANLFRAHGGLGLVLRLIRPRAPTLAELRLPSDLLELASLRHGLVLATGATGSGKSTTLAALIEHINRTSDRHVITLEDPIEFEHPAGRGLVHQREIGRHVDSFASGLRAALRESPDVVLVGEMRDPETIAAAITAAETGHLVFSTLHAGHAPMALDRIVDVFPEHRQVQIRAQLAGTLQAVVTQRLVPSRHPPGRVPALEIMRINTAVATKIREGRVHQISSEIQKGRAEGMVSFEVSLADLVRQGAITIDAATEYADTPALLRQML